jgi:RNA polymerase sigma-70 factor, ECF subfamily
MSGEQLVAACLRGVAGRDEAAWVEFLRRFQPMIASVVMKALRQRQGAVSAQLVDDLVQETYLKICANNFSALRTFEFRHENSLPAYLKTSALNVVQDHFRSTYAEKRGGTHQPQELDSLPESAGAYDNRAALFRQVSIQEIERYLHSADLGQNAARDRIVFLLYYRQGWTAASIAELPSIALSLKGVESTLLRLTRQLREALGMNGEQVETKG